jgi:hypothetical protein
MACLLRETDPPHRVVVAVRGTNPASILDWVLGDFWVAAKVPWPFGPDGAAVSASTALGLGIVRQLRARGDEPSLVGAVGDALARVTAPLRDAADSVVTPVVTAIATPFLQIGEELRLRWAELVTALGLASAPPRAALPPEPKVAALLALGRRSRVTMSSTSSAPSRTPPTICTTGSRSGHCGCSRAARASPSSSRAARAWSRHCAPSPTTPSAMLG